MKPLTGDKEYKDEVLNLSIRAQNVLINLGIKDTVSLLKLTSGELSMAWSCGKMTIKEIEDFQEKMKHQKLQCAIDDTSYTEEKHKSVEYGNEIFYLSSRARKILVRLGVQDISGLLNLTYSDLSKTWSCGVKTIEEILAFQKKMRSINYHESINNDILSSEKNGGEDSVKGIYLHNIDDDIARIEGKDKVIDAVKAVLSVRANSTLEKLSINTLEEFMHLSRERLLHSENCGRKTTDEILNFITNIEEFIRNHVNGTGKIKADKILAAPFFRIIDSSQENAEKSIEFFIDTENPAYWLIEWIRSLTRTKSPSQAFLLRKGMLGYPPMTLDQVGHEIGGVTRERARQMDKSVEKKIYAPHQQKRLQPLFELAVTIVKQRGGIIGVGDLVQDLLCKGKDGENLRYASELIMFLSTLKEWKRTGLLIDSDGCVRVGESRFLVKYLASVLEEVALSTADERHSNILWSIERECLKVALLKRAASISSATVIQNLSDVLLDNIIKLSKEKVKAHKNRIYSLDLWNLRFGRSTKLVDAVLRQFKEPVHFSKLAESVRKWNPIFSDNNTHAALDRSENALLWDRGTFIHKDNIIIPTDFLKNVEVWLLDKLKEEVPFVSINGAFLNFCSQCDKASIPSEIALYTCLRRMRNPDLEYPRLPFVYLKNNFIERIPVPLAVEEFLRDAGGKVSHIELKEFWIDKVFLKDFQFNQFSQKVPNVIRTINWDYIHLDNFKIDKVSMLPLIQYTMETLTKEEHCSVDKIYHDKRVTCKTLGIEDPMMLYSLLQCFADELFSLDGYPRIVRNIISKDKSRYTIKQHILNFIRNSGKPCPYEVLEKRFVEQLGYKEQQVYSVIQELEICLYHKGCLIHIDSLGWNNEKQTTLENEARRLCEDAHKAGILFARLSHLIESSHLPHLPSGLFWSNTMLADLLTMCGKFIVLGNAKEVFLLQENDHHIKSLEDLISTLLNREWNGAANLKAFESALREIGIIKGHLTPSMLETCQKVVIRNGEILLKELLPDAQRP